MRAPQVNVDKVTLLVAYTKTNTMTETIKQLSKKSIGTIFEWLQLSGLEHHPAAMIFKSGKVKNAKKTLSNVTIKKIYKDTWILMGLENETTNKGRYSQWSGHSCRVGATQDLNIHGATLPQIMAEGGWKNTETAMRYMRKTGSLISAVTKMMD